MGSKSSTDDRVAPLAAGRAAAYFNHQFNRVTSKAGLQYCALPAARRAGRHPWVRTADIIQLFNIHGGYMDVARLPVLANRAPLVWRLSDQWPMTGHCAYSGDCSRWKTGCGGCPDTAAYPPVGLDLTGYLWRRKKRFYRDLPMTIVAPSSWTEEAARQSPLLDEFPVVRIPNGIDVGAYSPMDRSEARKRLGVASGKTGILFCAHIAHDNPRKGTDTLAEALRTRPELRDSLLIVAGAGADHWRTAVSQDVHSLGYVGDEENLKLAYAASDIVVIPSAVENLPNTALEALAMSRPVVAADAGGVRDAVIHGETGFLSPPKQARELGGALGELLENEPLRAKLGMNGRRLIEQEFTRELELSRFENLYLNILGPS